MNKTAPQHEVRWSIIVDHPESRNDSFHAVPTGTVIHCRRSISPASARSLFAELTSGSDDFASEYVYKVSVIQYRDNSSPRNIRRPVERTRTISS